MVKINLNTRAAQDQIIAFQAAILAGDPLAPGAYADWLEENGHSLQALNVRQSAEKPGWYSTYPTMLHWNIHVSLAGKADRLVPKCTAFKGWYSSRVCEGLGNAIRARDYLPTLSRSNALQARLGRIVEALGHKVYWVA